MRAFLATFCGRALSLFLCPALLALTSCIPSVPLAPLAGVAEYQRLSLIEVGHVSINTAGGNLVFELPAMTVDTPLGPQSFGATYNAANGEWTWSYYGLFYDGETFVDATGHRNSLSYVDPQARLMPANRFWMPFGPHRMRTAGGMIYEFDPASARLQAILRADSEYPRLVILPNEIQQCSDASSCDILFEIGRDAAGRIISVSDRPGEEQRTALYAYDVLGRLTVARSAGDVEAGRAGFSLGYELLSPDLLDATTNSEGERVEYAYDSSRRVTEVKLIGNGDPTTQLSYGSVDDLAFTRVFGPAGGERVYRHDGYRQLRELTDAEGWTTRYDWEGLRLASHTDPAGVVTRWVHDGDVTVTYLPSGNQLTTQFLPYAVNLEDPWRPAVLSISDLDEEGEPRSLLQNSYDASGLLQSSANGEGISIGFAYADGQLWRRYVPNPNGGNDIRLLSEIYGPHGHPTEVGYEAVGIPTTKTQTFTSAGDPTSGPSMDHPEAEGRPNIRLLHYDHDRRLSAIEYGICVQDPQTNECSTTESWPDEGTTTITRRSDGRPLSILRPLGNAAELVYDANGQLVERRDKVGGSWQSTTFARDAAGRVTSINRPNGMTAAFEYDLDGRQTKATWTKPGAATMVRETAYAFGRVTSILDSTRGGVETLEYDAAGRVSAHNFPGGERMELAYDGRSRLTQRRLIFPDASESLLEVEYDDADSWTARKLDGVVFAEQSAPLGILHTKAFGTGDERVERQNLYSYLEGGRLVGTITRDAQGAMLAESDIQTDSGFDWEATLPWSSIELASGNVAMSEVLWEKIEPLAHVGPTVFGQGEYEVIGQTLPEQWFDYDAVGNRIDGAITYNSDHSRLESAFGLDYTSDASGYVDRIDDTVAGTSTVIVRNAQGRAIEIQRTGEAPISIDRDTWGNPLPDLFGGLVATGPGGERTLDLGDVRLDLGGGCHLGRYMDFRGNVRFTVDLCTGLPQKAMEYGAYGVAAVHGSDDDDRGFAQGRMLAPDLMLIGARLYQPSIGRFLSPDPIYQRGGQFAYAEGNPVQLWIRMVSGSFRSS